MKKLKFTLIFILLFKIASFSYGWGAVGHKIVADVAKSYVGKNIQDSVNKYLGDMSWESASTWMDEQRGNSKYDFMKEWHYLDLEKGQKYDSTNAKGNNVILQLQKAINNLMNRKKLTNEEINFNLKVLFHLMGDSHQPLHVGYGVDKGGNTIKVTFNGKSANLHHIWDSDIIEYKNITYNSIEGLLSKLSKRRIKKITDGDIIKWFENTRKYLDSVYSYTDVISEDYINKSASIIETQLLDAGVRLGSTLNIIFKKA
jgi:hypothetical protein